MEHKYVIVRASEAGCFAGLLAAIDGDVVTLTDARRIWYWAGAASLSQLAESGTSKPKQCKFPPPVARIQIRGWHEVIECSEIARKSIEEVPAWRE